MIRLCPASILVTALSLAVLQAPAHAETAGAQTIISVASDTSAADAQQKINVAIADAAKVGWIAINVSGADMFRFVYSEQALASGGVQGAKEYDVYVLLTCHPLRAKTTCPMPIARPGP